MVPCTFRHPCDPSIWVEVCCGVELHDQLFIPLCELLPNKVSYSTTLKAVLHSRIVLFIFLDVLPIYPSHVTNYGLLIKQNCLIEVLMFLCVEPVVNSSSSSGSIWIFCSPLSQP